MHHLHPCQHPSPAVTIAELTMICHNHSQFIIYGTVHSWCWAFYEKKILKSESHSVVSNSLWHHGLYRPGQNTEVGNLSLLQEIFPTQGSNPGLLHCRQILYQMSYKGTPKILEWVAYPFSTGSSRLRNWTGVSCIAGRFFTNWAMREALHSPSVLVLVCGFSQELSDDCVPAPVLSGVWAQGSTCNRCFQQELVSLWERIRAHLGPLCWDGQQGPQPKVWFGW